MTRNIAFGARLALFTLVAAGCSSDGDILPKKDRYIPARNDAGADVTVVDVDEKPEASIDVKPPRDPNANCVKPGTPNNERGVGGYCEPGRGDCPTEAGPRFCTADYREIAPVEDDKWFCSMLCSRDDDCGTGAICAMNSTASGCAPVVCIGDGGTMSKTPAGTNLSP